MVGGSKSRSIKQHIPTRCVGFMNPLQGVLYGRKIRLRWISEEMITALIRMIKILDKMIFVYAHSGWQHGKIGNPGSFRLRVLSYPVDRIVIVKSQQISTLFAKRVGFSHQLECPAGIGGENYHIVIW